MCCLIGNLLLDLGVSGGVGPLNTSELGGETRGVAGPLKLAVGAAGASARGAIAGAYAGAEGVPGADGDVSEF